MNNLQNDSYLLSLIWSGTGDPVEGVEGVTEEEEFSIWLIDWFGVFLALVDEYIWRDGVPGPKRRWNKSRVYQSSPLFSHYWSADSSPGR